MNWKSLAAELAVVVLGSNPTTAPLARYVAPAISETEDLLQGKSGAEKLAHAVNLVKAGISGANAVHPGTVDEHLTDALIAHSVSAVVDGTNLFHSRLLTAGAIPAALPIL